tara:strand:- start:76 stop:411 length:336 start_codon:yes stop_codon:yes gene_type:complete
MRITESRLRSVISKVISEMSHMIPQMDMSGRGAEHDISNFMDKAFACCSMPVASLFDMCAQICSRNESMARHCAELCACVCRGDEQGCCRCLEEICKCSHCAQICASCCGC